MNNLLRLLAVCGLSAFALLIIAAGLGRNNVDLLVPANMILFVLGAVFYVLPTVLALYRNCQAAVWITVVNVLFGWTILGWFVAVGWASTGKSRTQPPTTAVPSGRAIPGH